MYNLLSESLIKMDTDGGSGAGSPASLPGVYAALASDAVVAFPALRPYPRHSWHAFLVQLGAMAMHRGGVSEPPDDAAAWADLIRGLTPDWPDDEPWQLVVDDITKPALMQPPAKSAGKLAEYKNAVVTPDDLDLLVTAKNHDLKSAVGVNAGADDWVFALVSLQTMEGFTGAGNYGISRMNGGFGSRPAFSLTPSTRPGAHWRRDVQALLEQHQSLPGGRGTTLLWTVPWDGTAAEALTIDRLAPLYIEVCRRVRLRCDEEGRISAIRTSSKAARINAKAGNGITGDPWTLVDRRDKKGDKALTLPGGGFTYKRVVDYLDASKFVLSPLAGPTPDEQCSPGTMQLVARAMVRGQGKTEGYYERIIPLRPKVMRVFGRLGAPKELADIARERIGQVGMVQSILRHAITAFVCHADDDRTSAVLRARGQDNPLRRKVDEWVDKLDEIVDARFFYDLQVEFEEDDRAERERVRKEWLRNGKDGVVDHASKILQNATGALPCPAVHRYKARVKADSVFWRRLRGASGLPGDLFPERTEGDDDD